MNEIYLTSCSKLLKDVRLGLTIQESFYRLLCNTTRIGSTYSSNRALNELERSMTISSSIVNKSYVAIRKILRYQHPYINMEPMFDCDAEGEHTLKALLPYMISIGMTMVLYLRIIDTKSYWLLAIIYHYHYQFALTTQYHY